MWWQMWSTIEYVGSSLRNPAALGGVALTLLLSAFLTIPTARRLGWSTFGTWLSCLGLGWAVSMTLVGRLGREDLVWGAEAVAQCWTLTGRGWTTPEALPNLLLVLPLGLGLYLGSRNTVLSVWVVVATTALIETMQAISGLGVCQPSDLFLNTAGGLAGVGLGWLTIRMLGESAPAWLSRSPREGY